MVQQHHRPDISPPDCIDAFCRLPSMCPRGVTVSTLDSESSDRGSNPREDFLVPLCGAGPAHVIHVVTG
jgi:hypothetical protein